MSYIFHEDISKIFNFIFDEYRTNPNKSNTVINHDGLQLSPITVNAEYRAKWNIHENDFVVLTKNGEMLRPTLYRIGGINNPKLGVDKYFCLLKHVEAYYDTEWLKKVDSKSDPKHLDSIWVILDKDGNEKVVFDKFKSPYLIKNSCIYHIGNNYYNIESGELYCESFKNMDSEEFLFLDNSYDKNTSKRGVMKISKKDGTWELFKSK